MRSVFTPFVRVFAVAAALALSWPGLSAAEAEKDVAPSASELFGLARASAAPPVAASCNTREAGPSASQRSQQAQLARAMAALQAQYGDPSEGRALDSRKYHYPSAQNEMRRVHIDARAQAGR